MIGAQSIIRKAISALIAALPFKTSDKAARGNTQHFGGIRYSQSILLNYILSQNYAGMNRWFLSFKHVYLL